MNDKHLKYLLMAFACLAILLGGGMAHAAKMIDGSKPGDILEIAKGFGYATLDTDDDGDPMITGRIDGNRFVIHFYNCTNGENCGVILLRAAWISDNVDWETLNGWNTRMLVGMAYLDDENDPVIELPVILEGGVSADNLEEVFDYWRTVLGSFETEVIKD
ncbi:MULTISPECIES: YbjN domain-containing protein [Marinobacter]|uniref:Putative sensory transduction regulator n=1 Tax=Marinobacter pelagius TaxID=379482 RepID=A0A1I4REW7_9GAMM|nr:YbjN domain-containing protein [Marinobacter pelagius]SFM50767.1 Putative sensory transduction regulator [Marinobacter pelagius]